MNKIVQFEGQEVKVITDEGKVLINLSATAKVCGMEQQNTRGNKTKVRWQRVSERLLGISNKGTELEPQFKQEIKLVLDEIENVEDRSTIYVSSWLAKRFAMECHSEKAMQYKNFLATLDEQREQSLINTNSDDIVTMVTNTVNAIIPSIIQQFVPVMQENKKQIEQSRALLVDQANIYDEDRKNIRTMIGMKGVNVSYLTKKLKMVLSDFLGEKVMATDEIYLEGKFRILNKYNCAKWEDIPVEKLDDLYKTIDNVVDLYNGELPIKNKIYNKPNSNNVKKINFGKQIQTAIKEGKKHQKCACCGQWKETNTNNFYRDSNTSTGFKGVCKECKKKYYKENRLTRLSYQNNKAHANGVIPRSNYSFNKVN